HGLHLLGHRFGHVGGDEAGGYGVDGDTALAQLSRPDLCDTYHTRLGGDVIGLPEIAVVADHRACADDTPPAMRQHVGHYGLCAVEDARQVNADHGVPVGLAHLTDDGAFLDLQELGIAGDAGIVYEDVYPAEALHDGVDRGLDALRVGYVYLEEG